MILLIAYGNPLRRDDGAGLLLAGIMAQRWQAAEAPVRHLAVQQLTPELAVEIADPGVTAVVFVDARVSAADHAESDVIVKQLAAGEQSSPSVGHHLLPQVLLAYAELLLDGGPTPPAWLVTVPGLDFTHGDGLSRTASAAIEAALAGDDRPLRQFLHGMAAMARNESPP